MGHAKGLEDKVNAGWSVFVKGSADQKLAQEYIRARTAEIIKDPRLLEHMIPKWSLGCR